MCCMAGGQVAELGMRGPGRLVQCGARRTHPTWAFFHVLAAHAGVLPAPLPQAAGGRPSSVISTPRSPNISSHVSGLLFAEVRFVLSFSTLSTDLGLQPARPADKAGQEDESFEWLDLGKLGNDEIRFADCSFSLWQQQTNEQIWDVVGCWLHANVVVASPHCLQGAGAWRSSRVRAAACSHRCSGCGSHRRNRLRWVSAPTPHASLPLVLCLQVPPCLRFLVVTPQDAICSSALPQAPWRSRMLQAQRLPIRWQKTAMRRRLG